MTEKCYFCEKEIYNFVATLENGEEIEREKKDTCEDCAVKYVMAYEEPPKKEIT